AHHDERHERQAKADDARHTSHRSNTTNRDLRLPAGRSRRQKAGPAGVAGPSERSEPRWGELEGGEFPSPFENQTSRKRETAMAEPRAPTIMPTTTRKIPVPMTSLVLTANSWKSSTCRTACWAKLRTTNTTPNAPTAPMRPCTRPSNMNGTRMNQLVAPTSFITATSRRRA